MKKEFTGLGPHLRPVHADHAQPPRQRTLDSVLSAYGNYSRRVRPPLDRGILKISSVQFSPKSLQTAVTICSDFGAPKIKSDTVSTVSASISHEVMGPDAMIFVF